MHFNSRSIHAVNGDYELPPKEFDLLLFLGKNQGKILTKQQIYENVGGIQTVKGIGYRFNKEV